MRPILLRAVLLFTITAFGSGCAVLQPVAITNADCVGQIDAMPQGLVEVKDAQLLQAAMGEPGKGGLCMGKVYQAAKPVIVYRVWNSDKSYSKYGRWWSFEKPMGTRDEYRIKNGICPSWSELNMLSQCEIKTGEKIVVGPGQSAQCKSWQYPKSATNQVFIDNDSRNNQLLVEDCSAGENWPG
ncbi:hypothetical protein [Pelagibaculum spongiae]|uniref:Lipoprotein n=1 Tax=Pelagibaculum spongiae TaxID=2080658 RepID=A0A2V1H1Z4_9GAMM|nr:hypothetical protein [Pelagibaculum spongiae]PVZ70401.1 hypothetical protein DC094_07355 [Pelagibaculum spongiae]